MRLRVLQNFQESMLALLQQELIALKFSKQIVRFAEPAVIRRKIRNGLIPNVLVRLDG